ncbi:NADH:ubiquinone reductase (Na(+)-transporting) subunit C [Mangrovibacterium marinum]|uniref:Na(+)-translocating NADH-quinone reductase subunit C n=1 Tax=Mangrovibacterium marinum TaxID=1639118 RepID=A0A2T5BZX3_9BACT|nr:NADH:ubiquinone reductase (Na(+)-transporting) subunit C [Mangrovibacterium marinum]PTN07860.1 Na+-transporting NADH:ubiquinone oxidoreductase subunit C [Mangrovibacterium marinum]
MDRNSNVYTFIYASVMVILVAAILSFAAFNLKPYQAKNVEIEKKQNILASVNIAATAADAEQIYSEKIVNSYIVNAKGETLEGDAFTVDLKKERAKKVEDRQLPVFECNIDGGIKYILPLYGAGLWGPIWGYISVESDMNTIYGATFDHQGETPGLGAEIATKAFQEQFKGKTIFDEDGKFYSIVVAKSNETAPAEHKVDAISGGTITSKGLQTMVEDDLGAYKAFFNQKN